LSTCSVAENKGFHAGVTPVWTLVLLPTKLFTPIFIGDLHVRNSPFGLPLTMQLLVYPDKIGVYLSSHNRSFTYAMEKVVKL